MSKARSPEISSRFDSNVTIRPILFHINKSLSISSNLLTARKFDTCILGMGKPQPNNYHVDPTSGRLPSLAPVSCPMSRVKPRYWHHPHALPLGKGKEIRIAWGKSDVRRET